MSDRNKGFQVRKVSATLIILSLLSASVGVSALESPVPPSSPQTIVSQAPPPDNNPMRAYSAGLPEIVRMVDAKVDSEVIKAYIQNSTLSYHPTAAELIELRDRGASADLLKALLDHHAVAPANVLPATAGASAPPVAPTYAYGSQSPYDYGDYGYPDYSYAGYPYYYPYYYPYSYWWPSFAVGLYWPWYSHYWNGHGHFFAHNGFHGSHWGGAWAPHSWGSHSGGGFVAHGNVGFRGGFIGHSSGGFVGHSGGFMGHSGGFGAHGGGGFAAQGGGFGGHGGGGFGGHGGGGHR